MLKRLLKQDWDAIAGILAAIVALILHFLHITETDTILLIVVVLMALLLIRDFKRENQTEALALSAERISRALEELKQGIRPAEVNLIGPTELRTASLQFARQARGEVVWFNVCLRMYKAQQPFNLMLLPFIENPAVTSIQFVLNNTEKQRWQEDLVPKIKASPGGNKVDEPYWRELGDNISFVMIETGSEGQSQALVSFWGEPFMAVGIEKNVPRYVLHVKESSELIARLKEYERIRRAS